MPQPGPHIPAQLFDIAEPGPIFGITRYLELQVIGFRGRDQLLRHYGRYRFSHAVAEFPVLETPHVLHPLSFSDGVLPSFRD